MNKAKKKAYNRANYLKNREKILKKARQHSKKRELRFTNVVPLFESSRGLKVGTKEPPGSTRIPRLSRGSLFLFLFVLAMTFFLINEAASFYVSLDGNRWGGYLKALILEGSVVAFSLMKARTTFMSLVYKLMIAGIYVYSAWVMSGAIIHSSLHQQRETATNQTMAKELEAEISASISMRDRYLNSNRITLARKYDISLVDLNFRLNDLRKASIQLQNPVTIWNTLAILVSFRLLVMLSNLLCIQHLGRKARLGLRMV